MNMKSPMVSILCITYQHKTFIEEALNGFISQRTTFPIQVIVSEDCGSDGTRELCETYANKHPDLFFILNNTERLGVTGNYIRAIHHATGKYVALCEGDDYWTDPLKLQKQVDFLESHPEYSMCFHPVKVLKNDTGEIVDDFITREVPETTDICELAKGNYMHTCSVVYRNRPFEPGFAEVLKKSAIGDYVLHMFNAKHGLIKKLPDCMGVYRLGSGFWSGASPLRKYISSRKVCRSLKPYFDSEIRTRIEGQIQHYTRHIRMIREDEYQRLSNEELLERIFLVRNKREFKDMLRVVGSRIQRRLGKGIRDVSAKEES